MNDQRRYLALLIAIILPMIALFGFSSSVAYSSNEKPNDAQEYTNSEHKDSVSLNSIADDWFYSYELNNSIRYGTALGSGNFNDDNLTDLVVAGCFISCTLNILVQSPDGELINFGTTYTYTNGGSDHLLVADLNNDNLDDIAVIQQFSNPDSIKVFVQKSNSQFTPIIYPTDYRPDAITSGDFNNDGLTDLAASFFGAPVMGIFLQDVLGNLQPATYYGTSNRGFHDMATGDFNNDGLTDIVQTHGSYGLIGPSVTVFHQNLAGTFDPAMHYDIDPNQFYSANSVTAGDINNDGLDDILVQSGRGLSIFEQKVAGIPDIPTYYPGYGNPSDIEISDINLDGLNDVLALGDGFTDLALYLQQEIGNTLAPYETYPIAYGGSFFNTALGVEDINNDGRPDAMVGVRSNGLALLYHSVPDFGLAIDPASVTVNYGTDLVTFTMVISRLYNFTDTVSLSVIDLPKGTNHNLPSGPFETPSAFEFSVELTSTLETSFEPYMLEILGTSNEISHTTTANIFILHQAFLPILQKGY